MPSERLEKRSLRSDFLKLAWNLQAGGSNQSMRNTTKTLIYLADLGHNQLTVSSDVYPLGVANLATYARAHVLNGQNLRIQIFREPQDLKAAIDAEVPDILGLRSYSWNHNLALCFARYAKAS